MQRHKSRAHICREISCTNIFTYFLLSISSLDSYLNIRCFSTYAWTHMITPRDPFCNCNGNTFTFIDSIPGIFPLCYTRGIYMDCIPGDIYKDEIQYIYIDVTIQHLLWTKIIKTVSITLFILSFYKLQFTRLHIIFISIKSS